MREFLVEDIGSNIESLFRIGHCLKDLDLFTLFVHREDLFLDLTLIIGYYSVCSINNCLGGTVILFELEELIVIIIIFKFQDVFNPGPPERVNTLIIIANNAYVPVKGGEFFYNQVLRVVGILVFVNKNIMKLLLVFLKNITKVPKEYIGI